MFRFMGVSYQFDCNKNPERVSLRLLCDEISPSH